MCVERFLPIGVFVSLFLILAAALPATAVPDHEDDIYTWIVHSTDDDEVSGCTFVSRDLDDPEGETNPCEIISYEIGNTNTYAFFRWTMATLEFSELATHSGAYLMFDQGFRGTTNATGQAPFNFQIRVTGDDYEVESATPEDWFSQIEVAVSDDRSEGILTAAVPLSLIENTLMTGLYAKESFNLTRNPSVEQKFPQHQATCFTSYQNNLFCGGHELSSALANHTTYTLEPYLDLQPMPGVTYTNATGFPFNITIEFEPDLPRSPWISHTYVWNWTMDQPGIDVVFESHTEEGTAQVRLMDPSDEVLVDTEAEALTERLEDVAAGTWTVLVEVERFAGSLSLSLHPMDLTGDGVDGPSAGPDDEENGKNGDEGNDSPTDPDERGLPAPGAAFILVLLLTGLVALRRKNRHG